MDPSTYYLIRQNCSALSWVYPTQSKKSRQGDQDGREEGKEETELTLIKQWKEETEEEEVDPKGEE